jgi:hypothetical protein
VDIETNGERYFRMARETRTLAGDAPCKWRDDCLLIASIWQEMGDLEIARESVEARQSTPS